MMDASTDCTGDCAARSTACTAARFRAARAYASDKANPTTPMAAATTIASANPSAVACAAEAPPAAAPACPDDMMPIYNDGPMHAAICTNVVMSATPNGFC